MCWAAKSSRRNRALNTYLKTFCQSGIAAFVSCLLLPRCDTLTGRLDPLLRTLQTFEGAVAAAPVNQRPPSFFFSLDRTGGQQGTLGYVVLKRAAGVTYFLACTAAMFRLVMLHPTAYKWDYRSQHKRLSLKHFFLFQ